MTKEALVLIQVLTSTFKRQKANSLHFSKLSELTRGRLYQNVSSRYSALSFLTMEEKTRLSVAVSRLWVDTVRCPKVFHLSSPVTWLDVCVSLLSACSPFLSRQIQE